MRYIEAPAEVPTDSGSGPVVFLAGGITGVEDWQAHARTLFDDESALTLVNPRRSAFPVDDDAAHAEQVAWEHQALRRADLIVFWFAANAVQPIALFELGAQVGRNVPIVVGADPTYPRRRDVVEQLRHVRPGLQVWSTLADTITAAHDQLSSLHERWTVQAVTRVGLGFWRTSVVTDRGPTPPKVVWRKSRAWRAARAQKF